jgi:hypothetical protein
VFAAADVLFDPPLLLSQHVLGLLLPVPVGRPTRLHGYCISNGTPVSGLGKEAVQLPNGETVVRTGSYTLEVGGEQTLPSNNAW